MGIIKSQSVKDKFGGKNLCYLCRLSYHSCDKNKNKNYDETLPIEKEQNEYDVSNIMTIGMPILNLMNTLMPKPGASNEELQNVKLQYIEFEFSIAVYHVFVL